MNVVLADHLGQGIQSVGLAKSALRKSRVEANDRLDTVESGGLDGELLI